MSLIPLYPLRLEPALHARVWGGRRLATLLGKTLPTDDPYGESWEMHDSARVADGPLAGQTIGDVLATYGATLAGPANDPSKGMPLLAKLIDANDWLSVQVHPNDAQAALLEGEPRGKTEAWYVIEAEPGARLVIGVQPGSSRETIEAAIHANRLEELLVYAAVEAGDVLYVRAGTIHALGPGLLIYEIQQSSDTTYRLYDWGRVGLDGRPRALHIEQGLAVAETTALPQIIHTAADRSPVVPIVEGDYFKTELHQLGGANPAQAVLDTAGQRFHILTCIAGEAAIRWNEVEWPLEHGRSALIPAAIGAYRLHGTGRVLRSQQP